MKISDMMKEKFLVLDANDTLSFAAKKLASAGCSDAPVTKGGKFIGIFLTSDLAAALVKKGIFSSPSSADARRVRSEPVSKHIKNTRAWLHPATDLLSAFMFLTHYNAGAIPVVDRKNRVVGVVLASDLRDEMAKMLSAGGELPSRTPEKLREIEAAGGKTAIDHILHLVQQKGEASTAEVAKACELDISEVEEYALSLEKNRLLALDYDIFGKMKLKKPK